MPLLTEEGRFPAKVTAAELGESSKGTPFVQLNFETDEGSIARRLYLSEAAWDYSFRNLQEVFEFDGDFENLKQLVGKTCSITTENELGDDDKERLVVKWINGTGGPKLDPSKRQSLAARLSARAGVKPKAKPAATEETEEEPF